MKAKLLIVVVFGVVLLGMAQLARWKTVTGANGMVMWRTDRWTGRVWKCTVGDLRWKQVREMPAAEEFLGERKKPRWEDTAGLDPLGFELVKTNSARRDVFDELGGVLAKTNKTFTFEEAQEGK